MDNENNEEDRVSTSGGLATASRSTSRKDTKGNEIKKNGLHHPTFIDEVEPQTPVATIKEVRAVKNGSQGGCCVIS